MYRYGNARTMGYIIRVISLLRVKENGDYLLDIVLWGGNEILNTWFETRLNMNISDTNMKN
jgi:hypothetical protein